jgi:F-type H+-transporting ATPase subunit b
MAGENLTEQAGTSFLIAQAQTETTSEHGENTAVVAVDEHGNPIEVQELRDDIESAIGVHETGAHETGVFPPFDSATYGPQLFWLALTFGTLYLLMSKVALPRIGEILEVRRDRIEGDLAEAERLRQKTDQAIEAYESDLSAARAKSHSIADETRNKIKADMDEKHRSVEADLAKQMASAEARILKTKTEALSNVDQIASETAVSVVSKLSGKVSIKDARLAVSAIVKG